ncbi:MAG: aspartate aminotransferase, partial [Arenicella sp.]
MPSISSKGQSMPESPIRKLVPFAEKALKQGKEVLHLNIGQPDIATPSVALEAIKNIRREVIEYSHSAGFLSYRNKLSEYYKSVGIDVDSSEIL